MALTQFEQYIAQELSRKFALPTEELGPSLPGGFALKTRGVGAQLELVPFPSTGIFGEWDIATDPTVPAGGGPGALYEVIGANSTRSGEDFVAGDIAIILGDGDTSRNLTTFGVAGTPTAINPIVGGWDISGAADETVPGGAENGYMYQVTAGTYPHTHTSGSGAFVEEYIEGDLVVVIDKTIPIVRNLTFYTNLTGITSAVKSLWDINTLAGVPPVGASVWDIYEIEGIDYTDGGGQLHKAGDFVIIRDLVGPVIANLTRGIIDDTVTSAERAWSSTKIVDYLENVLIDDSAPSGANLVWSIDKIVAELNAKATLNDGVTSASEAWSSSKVVSYIGAHTSDTDIHFVINDAATTSTSVWSSDKIVAELSTISGLINDLAIAGNVTETWSANKLITTLQDPMLLHVADAAKHREINDAGTAVTDLWSADKITSYVATTSGAQIDDGAGAGDTGVTWSADRLHTDLVANHTDNLSLHRTINDSGSAVTDLWSADKILSELASIIGVTINDSATTGNTTEAWSADKVTSFVESHSSDVNIHRSINDLSTSTTELWSSDKIAAQIALIDGVAIQDGLITVTDAWSSSKIVTHIASAIAAVIDDGITNLTTTWSSTEIAAEIASATSAIDLTPIIDDGSTQGTTTWSSEKIEERIYTDFRSAIIRDDLVSSNNTTWSIDKIIAAIGSGGGGGGGGVEEWTPTELTLSKRSELFNKFDTVGVAIVDDFNGTFDQAVIASGNESPAFISDANGAFTLSSNNVGYYYTLDWDQAQAQPVAHSFYVGFVEQAWDSLTTPAISAVAVFEYEAVNDRYQLHYLGDATSSDSSSFTTVFVDVGSQLFLSVNDSGLILLFDGSVSTTVPIATHTLTTALPALLANQLTFELYLTDTDITVGTPSITTAIDEEPVTPYTYTGTPVVQNVIDGGSIVDPASYPVDPEDKAYIVSNMTPSVIASDIGDIENGMVVGFDGSGELASKTVTSDVSGGIELWTPQVIAKPLVINTADVPYTGAITADVVVTSDTSVITPISTGLDKIFAASSETSPVAFDEANAIYFNITPPTSQTISGSVCEVNILNSITQPTTGMYILRLTYDAITSGFYFQNSYTGNPISPVYTAAQIESTEWAMTVTLSSSLIAEYNLYADGVFVSTYNQDTTGETIVGNTHHIITAIGFTGGSDIDGAIYTQIRNPTHVIAGSSQFSGGDLIIDASSYPTGRDGKPYSVTGMTPTTVDSEIGDVSNGMVISFDAVGNLAFKPVTGDVSGGGIELWTPTTTETAITIDTTDLTFAGPPSATIVVTQDTSVVTPLYLGWESALAASTESTILAADEIRSTYFNLTLPTLQNVSGTMIAIYLYDDLVQPTNALPVVGLENDGVGGFQFANGFTGDPIGPVYTAAQIESTEWAMTVTINASLIADYHLYADGVLVTTYNQDTTEETFVGEAFHLFIIISSGIGGTLDGAIYTQIRNPTHVIAGSSQFSGGALIDTASYPVGREDKPYTITGMTPTTAISEIGDVSNGMVVSFDAVGNLAFKPVTATPDIDQGGQYRWTGKHNFEGIVEDRNLLFSSNDEFEVLESGKKYQIDISANGSLTPVFNLQEAIYSANPYSEIYIDVVGRPDKTLNLTAYTGQNFANGLTVYQIAGTASLKVVYGPYGLGGSYGWHVFEISANGSLSAHVAETINQPWDFILGATINGASITTKDYVDTSIYNLQVGTSYTVTAADAGKIIKCTNAADIALTVPTGLGAGFTFGIEQGGAGKITWSGTATVNNVDGHIRTRGIYAQATFASAVDGVMTVSGATE